MWLSINVLEDKIELGDLKRIIEEDEKFIITTVTSWIEKEYLKKIQKVPTFKSINMSKKTKSEFKIYYEIDESCDLSNCKDPNKSYFKNINFLDGYASDLKKIVYNAYGLFFKHLITWEDFEISNNKVLFDKDNLNNTNNTTMILPIKKECYFYDNNDFIFDSNFMKDLEKMKYFEFMIKTKKAIIVLNLIENLFNDDNKIKNIYFNKKKGEINITTNTRNNNAKNLEKLDFIKILLKNSFMSTLNRKKIIINNEMSKNEVLDILCKNIIKLTFEKDIEKVKNILNLKFIENEKNILSEYINNETKIRKTIKRI